MESIRIAFAALLCFFFFSAACNKDKGQSEKEKAAATTQVYQLRGVVTELPVASAKAEILIHHEQIPDFVDRKGEKTGMMSMVMPFFVGAGVSLKGVAVGDKVSFTLNVDWSRKDILEVTSLDKLPADTAMEL